MERAAIGSSHTLLRSASRLEERGYIEVIQGDRSKGQANRYRFKLSKGALLIGGEGGKKSSTTPIPCAPSDYFTPHHAWSGPSTTSTPAASLMKPGKSREMALRKLCEWGGEASIRDLAAALGTNHTTRTRRLLEVYEEAGVVKMDPKGKHGARVRLSDDWHKKLDEYRQRSGELADVRRKANKRYEKALAFRSPPNADK